MFNCGLVIMPLWTLVYLSHLNGLGHRISRCRLWILLVRSLEVSAWGGGGGVRMWENLLSFCSTVSTRASSEHHLFYISSCFVMFHLRKELHCFKNIKKYWNLFTAKVPLPTPQGISGSWEYSTSFPNVTGNFLRRVKLPRINHLIGQELDDGFSYSNLWKPNTQETMGKTQ